MRQVIQKAITIVLLLSAFPGRAESLEAVVNSTPNLAIQLPGDKEEGVLDPVASGQAPLLQIPEPKWEEFCPSQYLDAEFGAVHSDISGGAKLGGVIAMLATLPIGGLGVVPFGVARRKRAKQISEDEMRNYWAKRRQGFEAELATCQYTQDKVMCYMQVRQLEESKNAAKAASEEVQALRKKIDQQTNYTQSNRTTHCTPDYAGGYNCR